ncbi:MAG TPA: aminodeoxychorismate/anthranilate synthase component II [Candidatus Anoxymicrobiaceae bacterium]|jgi:anthranilate synthase/aminodeoxychorismate synthase-like glutamine amidotransferase
MSVHRVLLIDNYDSFTYNIAQCLSELGADVRVARNDEIGVEEIRQLTPSHLVISPGPGGPGDSGVSSDAIRAFVGALPILGVCLGHQVIGHVMGANVVRGPRPVHGSTSSITHDGRTIFAGIDSPIEATRYHSLVVDADTVPDCLEVTCRTGDGLVMGLRHREAVLEGVQFHPESILTNSGKAIFKNFLEMNGGDGDAS